MRAHAERHFALSAPADKDGKVSYRETLEGLLGRSRNPKSVAYYESELALPPMPMELHYLWRVFNRIRRRKGGSGFGASPIEWPDVDAFVRNSKFELAPWELEIVEMLDDVFMVQQARSQGGNTPASEGGE